MGKRWKPASFFDLRILLRTTPKRRQKAAGRGHGQPGEEQFFGEGEVLGLSERWQIEEHKRRWQDYKATIQDGARGCRGVCAAVRGIAGTCRGL